MLKSAFDEKVIFVKTYFVCFLAWKCVGNIACDRVDEGEHVCLIASIREIIK